MENLILNPTWQMGPRGGPQYFSSEGVTYDSLSIDGFRTCSISQSDGMAGFIRYDLPLVIAGASCLAWGFILRAVDADQIFIQADFYDSAENTITNKFYNIAPDVIYQFNWHLVWFNVPDNAQTVHLSMHFRGKITACTFYAPTAVYCQDIPSSSSSI